MAAVRSRKSHQLELPLPSGQRHVERSSASLRAPASRPSPRELFAPGAALKVTCTRGIELAADDWSDARQLGQALKLRLGGRLTLRVHENRSTMMSFRRQGDHVEVRVHRMFLDSDQATVRALAEYARTRSSRATAVIDQFVKGHREAIKPPEGPARPLNAAGTTHDVQALFDELNATYFDSTIEATIGWGRGSTTTARRSIRMGAYFEETKTILVHPALDRPEVPRWFVGFVVYHEMLHQAVPTRAGASGRRCIHPPEFRRRERLYAWHDAARSWERRHLSLLLRPARSG